MIREHVEKISSVLSELANTDETRDASKVGELLSTAYAESVALTEELNQTPNYKEMYEELFANHQNQSQILEEALAEGKDLKARLVDLENTIQSYEASMAEERAIRGDLEAQKEELIRRCAETEGKLAVANENNNPLQKEIFKSLQKIESSVSKLTGKVDNSKKELSTHSEEVAKLAKSVDALVKTNEGVSEVTQVYSETLEDLRGELNQAHDEFEEAIDAQETLKKEFKDVVADVEEISSDVEEVKEVAEASREKAEECASLFGRLKSAFGK